MRSRKYIILYVLLNELTILFSFQTKIKHSHEVSTTNKILEITVNIIQSCFNEKTDTIVLSGGWSNDEFCILNQTFMSLIPARLTGLYETKMFQRYKIDRSESTIPRFIIIKQKTYKVTNYVITVNSTASLSLALQRLRDSPLWNFEGLFLIVNKNVEEGCNMSREILYLVWSFNILSASVLCGNSNDQIRLYTFNPFTRFSPKFWNIIESGDVQNDGHWTLFEHKLETSFSSPSLSWCRNLNFEKTKNLGGYSLKYGIFIIEKPSPDAKIVDSLELTRRANAINALILEHLNATGHLKIYEGFCIQDEHNEVCQIMKDLIKRKLDYVSNPLFLHELWIQNTYPKQTDGLCIVASMVKYTITEKFLLSFSPEFWLYVLSTSIMASLFLKFSLHKNYVTSVLEYVRMLLSMPSLREPYGLARRLLFILLIFSAMMINSDFQSRMNAMRIAPDSDPTIESREDLEKSDLLLHGIEDFKQYFTDSELYSRYVVEPDFQACSKRLIKGQRIACLMPCIMRYVINENQATHVSKNIIVELYLTIHVRYDWPLLSRFDQLHYRLLEGGISKILEDRLIEQLYKNTILEDNKPKSLTFKELHIAFYFAYVGLVLATCTFLIELIVYNKKKYWNTLV